MRNATLLSISCILTTFNSYHSWIRKSSNLHAIVSYRYWRNDVSEINTILVKKQKITHIHISILDLFDCSWHYRHLFVLKISIEVMNRVEFDRKNEIGVRKQNHKNLHMSFSMMTRISLSRYMRILWLNMIERKEKLISEAKSMS